MGTVLDEFGFSLDEHNTNEESDSYIKDSLIKIEQAKNFMVNSEEETYAGIRIDGMAKSMTFCNTPNIPWKHVSLTINMCYLRDIVGGKLLILRIPEFVEEIRSLGGNKNTYLMNICNATSRLGSVLIPEDLLCISDNTFAFCKNLTILQFPENSKLIYLGKQAFAYCESLCYLDLSNCEFLDTIHENTFLESSIETLKLNSNIKNISPKVFENTRIKYVYIGDNRYDVEDFINRLEEQGKFWESADTYDF